MLNKAKIYSNQKYTLMQIRHLSDRFEIQLGLTRTKIQQEPNRIRKDRSRIKKQILVQTRSGFQNLKIQQQSDQVQSVSYMDSLRKFDRPGFLVKNVLDSMISINTVFQYSLTTRRSTPIHFRVSFVPEVLLR